MKNYIELQITETKRVMSAMLADAALLKSVESAAGACIDCLNNGNKILLVGNGGSAGDAQHIAGEFVSRFALFTIPSNIGTILSGIFDLKKRR